MRSPMKYLLVTVCCGVLLLIPWSPAQDSAALVAPRQGLLTSGNGRFVFGQVSPNRADQFMLDTQTGRLWQLETVGTNTELQLFPIKYNVLLSGAWTHSWGPINEADYEAKQNATHP